MGQSLIHVIHFPIRSDPLSFSVKVCGVCAWRVDVCGSCGFFIIIYSYIIIFNIETNNVEAIEQVTQKQRTLTCKLRTLYYTILRPTTRPSEWLAAKSGDVSGSSTDPSRCEHEGNALTTPE